MKKLKLLSLLFFVALCCAKPARAQQTKMSEHDWDTLIYHLQNENWTTAEKIASGYLKRFTLSDDSTAEPAIVRYIYLRCIGGLVGEKKYNKEQALKKLKDFKGRNVISPYLTFDTTCVFNCFHLNDDKSSVFLTAANAAGTVIYSFETFNMLDLDILNSPDAYQGKVIRIGAFVKEINTGGSMMPRLEISLYDGFVWDIYEEEE